MSQCVKTGLDIYLACCGALYHTDCHSEGDCLIFTCCDDAHMRHGFIHEGDLVIEGGHFFKHDGGDGTIVVEARHCVVQSEALRLQWARYCPDLLHFVSTNIIKE